MRVLITGATGFAGRHLSRLALSRGAHVYGLARPASVSRLVEGVEPVQADLSQLNELRAMLEKAQPEWIFHLAGQASIASARENPQLTFETNVSGTRRLLDAVLSLSTRPRILVACSSDAYGLSAQSGKKLTEEDRLQPLNDYGRSKAEQESVAMAYQGQFGMHIICMRAFNHLGPGQSRGFVAADFAAQIAAIEKRLQQPDMRVGNIESVRDFSDVRDVVQAYWLALEKGTSGEVYNVASGEGHRVSEILQFYLKRVSVTIKVHSEPRPSDIPYFVGDAGKLARAVGWKPVIPFEAALQDVLEDWRKRING
jgi:GDP-4-dehydro-6-deoxy-D-mannose reductase